MKQIKFRLTDDEYEKINTRLRDELNVSVPLFFKAMGLEILNRDFNIKKNLADNNINLDNISDYTDKKLQVLVTYEHYVALKKMADKHGWSLSKEIRFRLQLTLSNQMDFFDEEITEMRICRNQIKRIGVNINMIQRKDTYQVLDKAGFKQDIDELKLQLSELEKKFNYFLKQCKRRTTSSKG